MPHGKKNDAGKGRDFDPIGETGENKETFGEALSKAGFEPAKVGRKIVSQGKRSAALKKWESKSPDN
ncbi:hypothetical protein [Ensifer adhaerens]|uniref:hypothetical protein n=1 Tax=Ensifer adhaerens TaxID=106592 RepID=UPI00098FE598|nr:hypothetical protein [Ensifer adhaerens]